MLISLLKLQIMFLNRIMLYYRLVMSFVFYYSLNIHVLDFMESN